MSLVGRPPSALDQHMAIWGMCRRCPLADRVTRKCHHRGHDSPQFLFVGEGPGQSEDAIGEPFVGRAGKLLDQWIEAVLNGGPPFTYAMCNLVACRPCDHRGGPNRTPTGHEIAACGERLGRLVEILAPDKGIILLGRTAQENFPFLADQLGLDGDLAYLDLIHPAAVCRQGGLKSQASRQAIKKLRHFIRGLF